MKEKRAQFNFVWLFALLVGGAILVLAIYGALQSGDTQRFVQDSEIAVKIDVLTDPLQAGFSEGSYGSITFSEETRISNFCFDEDDSFGRNELEVSTQSSVGNEWNLPGVESTIPNKYIFSREHVIGKEFFVFSKPFEFPYKVADMIFLTSEYYCFVNPPEVVRDEILGLAVPNVEVDTCEHKDALNVCFGSGDDCDIFVYATDTTYEKGRVVKNGKDMDFVDNLLYAAIFSEQENYECNVGRLLYRTGKIAEQLGEKAAFMGVRGCNTNLEARMIGWDAFVRNAEARELLQLEGSAKTLEIQEKNEITCGGLWK